ncbi:hypothetical protein AB0L13_44780 [Saccharopolyspora shandongensis]|uniref:hypothetical protein n=1 Tax=Saccharopolyspora shandongensis TaxID=418495 RepID=UPI003421413F
MPRSWQLVSMWYSSVQRLQCAVTLDPSSLPRIGKSELLAFIALYLLACDGVEGAEIYGCAMDRGQAAKVFDVAAQRVKLSPVLFSRLVVKDHIKRIIDERTGSYYEVVAADAAGNLGTTRTAWSSMKC